MFVERPVIITPCVAPPSRTSVQNWLDNRNIPSSKHNFPVKKTKDGKFDNKSGCVIQERPFLHPGRSELYSPSDANCFQPSLLFQHSDKKLVSQQIPCEQELRESSTLLNIPATPTVRMDNPTSVDVTPPLHSTPDILHTELKVPPPDFTPIRRKRRRQEGSEKKEALLKEEEKLTQRRSQSKSLRRFLLANPTQV